MRSYRRSDELSGESRDHTSGPLLLEMRGHLNRIVTGCELLKLELPPQSGEEAREHLKSIMMQTGLISQDFQQLVAGLSSAAAQRQIETCDRILKALSVISFLLQEIGKGSGGFSEPAIGKDLLQTEFATLRLSRMIEEVWAAAAALHAGQAASAAPVLKGPGPASDLSRPAPSEQVILIVDDDANNRDILTRLLRREGRRIVAVSSGEEALEFVNRDSADLLLLDVLMPETNGFDVLRMLRSTEQTANLPIMMVSGMDGIDSVAACIELGADDYVLKPVNPTILRARVRSLLEKKQAREREQARAEQLRAAFQELELQKREAELLLQNILPFEVAEELKNNGRVSPRYFEDVTIVFTDFVNFTASTEALAADDLVVALNDYFTAFDFVVDRYQLERLKTVGDSYIFLSGMPKRVPSHPVDAVLASMEMLEFVRMRQAANKGPTAWSMRIGINTGPVIAGVVGTRKFAFDVWGETVNFGSRMVSASQPNRINISADTFQRVKEFFSCSPRGEVRIKGNRWREMYFVDGILPPLKATQQQTRPGMFSARYREYFQRELIAFPGSVVNERAEIDFGMDLPQAGR